MSWRKETHVFNDSRAADRTKWAKLRQISPEWGIGLAHFVLRHHRELLATHANTNSLVWIYPQFYTHTHTTDCLVKGYGAVPWLKGWQIFGGRKECKNLDRLTRPPAALSSNLLSDFYLLFSLLPLPCFMPCVHHWLLSFPSASRNC